MIICQECKKLCTMTKEGVATFVDADDARVRYNAKAMVWTCGKCGRSVVQKVGGFELQRSERGDVDGEYIFEEDKL